MVRDRANYYKELLGGKSVVKIFGQRSELLSYDMVVADKISSRADKFKDIYRQKRQSKHQNPSDNHEGTDDNCARWRLQNRELRQNTQGIHNGIHIDTKLRLVGLERHINYKEILMNQMRQEQVNNQINELVQEIIHLHEGNNDGQDLNRIIAEKCKQMEKMLPFPGKEVKDRIEQLKGANESSYNGRPFSSSEHPLFSYLMPDDMKLRLIFKNLAINEHLRWVASLEMLGYTGPNEEQKGTMTRCDDVAMIHPGMVEWNDPCNEENKAFDYQLVKTSFEQAYTILNDQETTYEQTRREVLKNALIKELKNQKLDQSQKDNLIKKIEQVLDEETKQPDREDLSEVAEETRANE